jgi:hypothetical protein
MDEFRARVCRQCCKHQIAIFTIADTSPDLDQFMIMQGLPEFVDDAIGQAALADQHQRVQGVSEPPQVFFLSIRECHELIIGLQAGIRS